jgi:hypothetical protein
VSAGKGDAPRPVDGQKYRENWDEIFAREGEKTLASMSAFVHICTHTTAATTPNDVEPAAHAN